MNKINCPACHNELILDDLMERQILEKHQATISANVKVKEEELQQKLKKFEQEKIEFEEKSRLAREEYKNRLIADRKTITEEMKEKIHTEFRLKLENMEKQLTDKEVKLIEAQKAELELIRQKKEIQERQNALELDIAKRVQSEIDLVRKKIEEETNIAVRKVSEELRLKEQKIREYQESEIVLLRQKTELDEKMQAVELEVLRKVDEERHRIRTDAIKTIEEQYKFQTLDKEKTIADLKKMIEELNVKMSESSQQKKGEVAEIEVENVLTSIYKVDKIDAVPKGVKGADVIQTVKNQFGANCGRIIIEAKRTKSWSNAWIQKLKLDQNEMNAEIAVLITSAMPDGKDKFMNIDGVWVTDFFTFTELISVLRIHIIEIYRLNSIKDNKECKMTDVYQYVSGVEFNQKVTAVMETLAQMKHDFIYEKNMVQKLWAKREKQIENIANTTSRLTGDLEGLLGIDSKEQEVMVHEYAGDRPSLIMGGAY